MDIGATRYFASVLREFTQTLGKERFFLLGEITGGRERAFKTLAATGLDAALGVDDIRTSWSTWSRAPATLGSTSTSSAIHCCWTKNRTSGSATRS